MENDNLKTESNNANVLLGEVTIKEGDYVITEDFRLLQIKSIEERQNGNLRYNFTNGKFGLKDETKLGCPNSSYTKVDVSQCNFA